MKRVLAIVCTLMMLFFLAACGNGSANSEVVGTYRLFSTETESEGTILTRESMMAMGVTEEDFDSMFVLEMKEDGTYSMSLNGDTLTDKYKKDVVIIFGEKVPYTYEDGKISMTLSQWDGSTATMVFEKKQ